MGSADVALLVAAGVLAGIVGSAGGITSLVSYPALLAAGLSPLSADVVNMVAIVVCWPGSALASRPELEGRGAWLARWSPLAAAGGCAGAGLLVSTPAGLFAHIVPYLVAAASIGLLLQPRLRRLHERLSGPAARIVMPVGMTSVAAYNGYFGAGAGVMTLTLMMITVDPDLPRANALKNMLIGAATAASAAVLIAAAPVRWSAVLPLAAGLLVGSAMGPRAARRLPPDLLRWLVALVGIGLAIELWMSAA